jgi:uncharacterized protein (DUF433 family)
MPAAGCHPPYPGFSREDIIAALDYAGQMIDEERIIPRG